MSSPTPGDGFTRFLTLADVAEILNVELDVVQGLVESNELAAIRIGTVGHFRVEQRELEQFIDDQYEARRREAIFEQQEYIDIPEISAIHVFSRSN